MKCLSAAELGPRPKRADSSLSSFTRSTTRTCTAKARASARARVSRANGTFTFSFLDDSS